MRLGGDPRRRLRRAATALVALTLLPVAVMIATGPIYGPIHASNGSFGQALVRAQDADLPAADAIQRGQESNLFAPFSWENGVVSGPFLRFGFAPATGLITDYMAVNGTATSMLINSIQIQGFTSTSTPLATGATFAAASGDAMIVVHDEPMALLEIRTLARPQNVTFHFPIGTTGLQVSHATTWPASGLSFTDGNNTGRILVGQGNLSVNGTRVSASMRAGDYLALRAVSTFAEHPAERTAVLDAFGSGRLAAEFDLVAVSNGGWLENSAQFHPGLDMVDSSVQFQRAAVRLGATTAHGGLVLFAFDPRTMPVDSQHRLVVRTNGDDIPQTVDPLASLFALPGSSDHAAYVRLSMNATVLAVYVPDLSSANLQVESIAVPSPGIDRPTQLAIVAAVFVVTVAAAIMFRRPQS